MHMLRSILTITAINNIIVANPNKLLSTVFNQRYLSWWSCLLHVSIVGISGLYETITCENDQCKCHQISHIWQNRYHVEWFYGFSFHLFLFPSMAALAATEISSTIKKCQAMCVYSRKMPFFWSRTREEKQFILWIATSNMQNMCFHFVSIKIERTWLCWFVILAACITYLILMLFSMSRVIFPTKKNKMERVVCQICTWKFMHVREGELQRTSRIDKRWAKISH